MLTRVNKVFCNSLHTYILLVYASHSSFLFSKNYLSLFLFISAHLRSTLGASHHSTFMFVILFLVCCTLLLLQFFCCCYKRRSYFPFNTHNLSLALHCCCYRLLASSSSLLWLYCLYDMKFLPQQQVGLVFSYLVDLIL